MKISGFTMGKNVDKLYYPIKEAIMCILPIVDEFVVALGDSDKDDKTREIIESIGSTKIKIVDTVWDTKKYPRGMENAHQTDIAKSHCSGDWLIYLQADEVIHEKFLPVIKEACLTYLMDHEVEGFVFNYKHFWGDYNHYHRSHGWYPTEIRIIRNNPDIHSWESAQSFRRIPNFDGLNYRVKENTYKLKVIKLDADVYHYGWVRPPHLMVTKSKALETIHRGAEQVKEKYKNTAPEFDYGPLNRLNEFNDTHPEVMKEFIAKMNWQDKLQLNGKRRKDRPPHKHEQFKYRLLTWLEQNIMGGRPIGGWKNYILLEK
jgi:hypothetical protein